MRIGVIKEIKVKEARVAMTPAGAKLLVTAGHDLFVEVAAGMGSGFTDQDYASAGAKLVTGREAWDCELVAKVKEPLEVEYQFLQDQMVFTFFHLAGAPKALTDVLLQRKTTAIAYETLEDEKGGLPLLAPMSAIAGNMSVLMGAYYLASFNHGKGMQLGTVLGQHYGKVVIIGDGVVGRHAAKVADSMGASVYVAGLYPEREAQLKRQISNRVNYFFSAPENIAAHLLDADLVVGAALHRGEKAMHIVTESMVKGMRVGSVIVDVSIDQGGCIETSRPTSHTAPVFEKYGVIHYCVTNMPGAYPQTSTLALTNVSLPYFRRLADKGIGVVKKDYGFAKAVNTYQGFITYRPLAETLNIKARYRALEKLIEHEEGAGAR